MKPLDRKDVKLEAPKPGDPPEPARGLIRNGKPITGLIHDRVLPPHDLKDLIRHFWWVEWNLTFPSLQQNLPHPAIHLVFQEGEAHIFGVTQKRFHIELQNSGWVFGIKFQPGAFFAFLQKPVASLRNKVFPASTILGDCVQQLNQEIHAAHNMELRMTIASEFLRNQNPTIPEEALLASRLVHRLENERHLLKVEDLCESEGISLRKLQRLFQKYVGVSPKWVIGRYRLHEALERIDHALQNKSYKIDWADFALGLGYYDQAHFIKDFSNLIGSTPEEYEKKAKSMGIPEVYDNTT